MSETFLEKVCAEVPARVLVDSSGGRDVVMRRRAEIGGLPGGSSLYDALAREDRTNIIAEIKRASPSKGVIQRDAEVDEVAKSYESGGAAAISVLTEPKYFLGAARDLRRARLSVGLPILRKDFIIDEFQIYEARAYGANAVLLIVAALSALELERLFQLARGLGMDTLVEVHTRAELEIAAEIGANIVGINNRNLSSLEVSLDVSRELIAYRPQGALMVAESGLSTRQEIEELKRLGFNGFLIGEALMRSGNAAGLLGGLV